MKVPRPGTTSSTDERNEALRRKEADRRAPEMDDHERLPLR